MLTPFVPADGTLYLRPPVRFTLDKLRALLRSDAGYREADGVVTLRVTGDGCGALGKLLRDSFSSVEMEGIRAMYLDDGAVPTMATYLESESLGRVIAKWGAANLLEAIAERRLDAAFQPIVDLADGSVYAHEGLLRIDSTTGIAGPMEIFDIARAADLMSSIDLAARQTIITAAARRHVASRLFINFMPTSIYDPKTCLRSTIATLDELGFAHDRIVFEVVESEAVADVGHLRRIMNAYRAAGFRIALDDLGSGFSSLNLLHQLRPDFVKLDIGLIRDVDRDPFKAALARKLIEASRETEMRVIAEGIETAGELDWLRANGAQYGQGFFIARPAAEPLERVALQPA